LGVANDWLLPRKPYVCYYQPSAVTFPQQADGVIDSRWFASQRNDGVGWGKRIGNDQKLANARHASPC
jgi:hypothetical protein